MNKLIKAKYDKNRRKIHILNGMCSCHPNTPLIINKKYCQKCVDNLKKHRLISIQNNKCPTHPNISLIKGLKCCQKCVDNRKKQRKKLLKSGRCPNHPNRHVVFGKTKCRQCLISSKKYCKNNKSRKSIYDSNYRKINKTIISKRNANYYSNNKKKICVKVKQYRNSKEGKINHNLHNNKRRESKNNVIHTYTKGEWNEKVKQTNGICLEKYGGCGKRKKLTLDHIYPLSKANEDFLKTGVKRVYTIDDVNPLCKNCQSKWGNKIKNLI